MNAYETLSLPFGAKIDEDGIWCQILNRPQERGPCPVLFLDRDGVIVEDVHYLRQAQDVQLIDGAAKVITAANSRNIPVIIVTNQAGIARGKFEWQDFIAVQEQMLGDLDAENAFVNAVYACPFHSEGRPPYRHPDHPCRKPNSGMLDKAAQHFSIEWKNSWIIGDRANDLIAGKTAGLAGGIQVATGHGSELKEQQSAREIQTPEFSVLQSSSISNAVDLLDLLN